MGLRETDSPFVGAIVRQLIGSVLVGVGTTWYAISSCATIIVGILIWLSVLIWLATSTWGGIIWAVLWLFFGGGLILGLFGLITAPVSLLGVGVAALGEKLRNSEEDNHLYEARDNIVDSVVVGDRCADCGNDRVSQDDRYCRFCGAQYG